MYCNEMNFSIAIIYTYFNYMYVSYSHRVLQVYYVTIQINQLWIYAILCIWSWSWLDYYTNCVMFSCRYASGTLPWGNPNTPGFEPQRHDDGYLEVIGFTYSSLVRLLTIEEMLLTLMLIAESCTLYTREINVEIFIHSELSYYNDWTHIKSSRL